MAASSSFTASLRSGAAHLLAASLLLSACQAGTGGAAVGSQNPSPVPLPPRTAAASVAPQTAPQSVEDAIARFREKTGVKDFSVLVMRGEDVLLLRHEGRFEASTQIAIASSSKWMVGATIMALVDEGLLDLDAPIGRYVADLPPDYARLPLAQLLSYTAGLPSLAKFVEFKQPPTIPLAESARLAAREPLISKPGTQFDYGGANLQFLGAAAEKVTGQSWQQVFDDRIARPLGMTNTLWGGTFARPTRTTLPNNPMLQGGAWTTVGDYGAFLTMIAADGTYHGRRILSAKAVERMRGVMTVGLRKGFTAPGAQGREVEYALAHWCERLVEGRCLFESSPGLFGTYPWVDRASGLHGVIFVKDRLQRIAEDERALRNALITEYASSQQSEGGPK